MVKTSRGAVYLIIVLFILWSGILACAISVESDINVDKEKLETLLPVERELPGWKIAAEPRFFEPGNLWEYINGQAELYLQYGFRLVVTSDYGANEDESSIIVEIYRMESPLHGFGIYAAERSPEDNFIDVGVQGYVADDILNFWKGPYYVKITSLEFSDSTKDTLNKFAKVIAQKISGDYKVPELFTLFPENNKIANSERFIPSNFMGHSFLKNGYRIDYQQNGLQYQIFLIKNSSSEEAYDAFAKYREFLESNNEKVDQEKRDDYQIIKVEGRKKSVVFQYHSFIGGVLKIEYFSMGDKIVEEVINKLSNRNK
jgi:hypothetical protein